MKKFFPFLFAFVILSGVEASAQNWLWAKSGIGRLDNEGSCVSADANGNVLVTGYFDSHTLTFDTYTLTNTNPTGQTDDVFIVKYDSNGNVLWAKVAKGTGDDESYSICPDAGGNVFVTGCFYSDTIVFGSTILTNNTGYSKMFIVKYDSNGNVIWAKSAGGTGFNVGYSANTDASGNVFVTGNFDSTLTIGSTALIAVGGYDIFIAKYDANGNVIWAKSAGGTLGDVGYSVSTDASGNVFVTGMFSSPSVTFGTSTLTNAGNWDVFIAKYDAIGNVLWAKCVGGIYADYASSISADAGGNVFVTGYFQSPTISFGSTTLINTNLSGGNFDVFIAKYDANGILLWANSTVGTSTWPMSSSASADANGNVFVTGLFNSHSISFSFITLTNVDTTGNTFDVFISKYDSNGNVLCASALSNGGDEITVSTDSFGNAYIGGDFYTDSLIVGTDTLFSSATYSGNVFVAKYICDKVTAMNELSKAENVSVFPNPFSTSATVNINGQLKINNGEFSMYDVFGREVKKISVVNFPFTIQRDDLPSGVYFYRIVFPPSPAGEGRGEGATGKLVVQ